MVKKYKKKDPHRGREEQKYDNPVPSREYILQYLKEVKEPVDLAHLQDAFGLVKEEEMDGFLFRLKAMLRDRQLHKNRHGGFAPTDNRKAFKGDVVGHPDGFGFVCLDNPQDDIFLNEKEMRGVFSGDRVLVRILQGKSKRRKEGRIVKVLERNTTELVGRLVMGNGFTYVQPDDRTQNQRVTVRTKDLKGALADDFVLIKITKQPTYSSFANGDIVKVLGNELTPGLEIDLSISNHKIPYQWPPAVIKSSKKIPKDVQPGDIKGRLDLREYPFVTIDGEDAQDFDDAVYCEPQKAGGWLLYVAIADVAHYVKPNSGLDKEAQLRGNSVYFPGRVVPMLPESLSNGLCSLRPKVDRLTVVAKLKVDQDGKLLDTSFHNAVIHSHARLTYSEVAEALEAQNDHPMLTSLNPLYDLFKVLLKRRESRGALDFSTKETRILFNHYEKIERIVPSERNDAHRVIEECMLLANVAAAQYLEKSGIPAIYRVHVAPDSMRVEQLRAFLKLFGLSLGGKDEPTSLDFAKVLADINQREDGHILQITVLRTLTQAVYKSSNDGHFGLAYDGYTHFTSPIRRYPDLMVHRALKWLIDNKKVSDFAYKSDDMAEIAMVSSRTERRADLATREAEDRLKCDFMEDKVGLEFDGTIVDVTNFGVFVELDQVYVQGLVHVTSLKNDYYQFDEVQRVLIGEKSGTAYRMGNPLRVIVSRVDKERRFIDFNVA